MHLIAVIQSDYRVTPNLPGFIQTINPNINVDAGIRLFDVAWLLGFSLSFASYAFICLFWPAPDIKVAIPVLPDDVYCDASESISSSAEEEKHSIKL